MSGFSPEWLALREPVDHRSRNVALARRLETHFKDRGTLSIVDLGCGTGSNLRGTYRLLPAEQHWTLVDYDPQLLSAARERLAGWADGYEAIGDAASGHGGLRLDKDGRHLTVRFRQADLNADLDRALGPAADLVTASAFFDLCSPAFIGRMAAAVARLRAVFFTVLTYNGEQLWTPSHPCDGEFAAAFHAHQRTDKGFGQAAGPAAPAELRKALEAMGAVVHEGDSPWILGAAEQGLIDDLATGFAGAVAETGAIDQARIASWRGVRRAGARVGHTDTLALPPR